MKQRLRLENIKEINEFVKVYLGKMLAKNYQVNENNNTYYLGKFNEKGRLVGYGIQVNKKGIPIYAGNFSEGKQNGNGISFRQNMTVEYKGKFKNNKKHGVGTEYHENGESPLYKGLFEKGVRSGNGVEYREKKGKILYEGSFFNGKYSGNGTLYEPNGRILYKGQFLEGLFNGEGTIMLSNGKKKGNSNGNKHKDEYYNGYFQEGKAVSVITLNEYMNTRGRHNFYKPNGPGSRLAKKRWDQLKEKLKLENELMGLRKQVGLSARNSEIHTKRERRQNNMKYNELTYEKFLEQQQEEYKKEYKEFLELLNKRTLRIYNNNFFNNRSNSNSNRT